MIARAAWIPLAALALALLPGCRESGLSLMGGEKIADLREPRQDVKVRRAHQMAWNDAPDGSGLQSYDAVRTGAASSGLIRYTDESVLRLGENTMIIVVDREQKKGSGETSVVALPSGTVEGRIDSNSERKIDIEVRTPRGWIKASNRTADGRPNPFRFKTAMGDDGAVQVTADSGEVKFVAKGIEKSVTRDQALSLPAVPGYQAPDKSKGNKELTDQAFKELPDFQLRVWNTGERQIWETAAEPGVDLFLIKEPRDRVMVSDEVITVRGELSGRVRAYLLDTPIQPDSQGRFAVAVRLERGANSLEFRITTPGPGGKGETTQAELLTVIRR
ncbi:MAG: FecR domain-containing protein [Bdellovibrionales bacterium]|nr:FecR domain-containing protein [Bdellovibrionales bacterium]